MDLPGRKRVEAARRLLTFDGELKRWLVHSGMGGALQRHGSQIRAVEQMLGALRAGIGGLLPEKEEEPAALDACVESSRLALALFGIWDFFRLKLDQRRDSAYAEALRIADELAWVCYRPVRDRGVKEPPLVFFNSGTSPFILRREARFYADGLPRELLATEAVTDAMARLPFPVIGVPWNQIAHLPDAVVVAHEVGHAVEGDLGLTVDLGKAIDAALARREQGAERELHWKRWLSEVFADCYGCLAAGPAFARALCDFLAAPEAGLLAEQPSASSYPPASVRVRFNAAVLDSMTLTAAGTKLWSDWQGVYTPLPAALEPFLGDAGEVAAELVTRPLAALEEKPLTSLLTFTTEQLTLAESLATTAANQELLPEVPDLMALFAAVRIAYENDPRGYDRRPLAEVKSTLERLQERIADNVKDVYRAEEKPYSEGEREAHDQAHRARGSKWLEDLRATIAASSP